MNLNSDLSALLRSPANEVFDAGYYLSRYRNEIPVGMDPVEHFVLSGLENGFKPNAGFDPLILQLQGSRLDREHVIKRLLESSATLPPASAITKLLPGIKALDQFRPRRTLPNDGMANVRAARNYGRESLTSFSAGGRLYALNAPAASAFLNRLRDDKPFSFVRIGHGDWDCIHAYEYYRSEIRAAVAGLGFNEAHVARLAMRYCDQVLVDQSVYAENFYPEFLKDLESHSRDKDLLHSVAFKGYPTADERLFEWSADDNLHPTDIVKLKLFSDYFDPDEVIYDSTVWKRWLISGDLAGLPALARERPVIFMGAGRVATLNERWQLPWYLYIPIPPEEAYELRHSLIDVCREKIVEANEIARRNNTKRPLFILQGSSFAYWFVVRLFQSNPDIFYWDFGQAIHPWFYDVKEIGLLNWGRLYGPTIVSNNSLEDFYRQQGISDPVIENLFRDRLKTVNSTV